MGDYFLAGGPVMWPLLGLAVLCAAIIVDRAVFWTRLGRSRNSALVDKFLACVATGDLAEADAIAHGTKDPVLRTLHAGLEERDRSVVKAMACQSKEEFGEMKRHLALLDTVMVAAPLLGILGTITGIMGVFQTIGGLGEDSTPYAVGIAGSLLATVFGLFISIAALFPRLFFKKKAQGLAEEMEKRALSLDLVLAVQHTFSSDPVLVPVSQSLETLGGLSEKEKHFFLS